MIRDLRNLYTVVVSNKVVLFGTNLSDFIKDLKKIEPEIRNYDYYYRKFKKTDQIEFTNSNGKKYHLQKVL